MAADFCGTSSAAVLCVRVGGRWRSGEIGGSAELPALAAGCGIELAFIAALQRLAGRSRSRARTMVGVGVVRSCCPGGGRAVAVSDGRERAGHAEAGGSDGFGRVGDDCS